MHAVCYDIIQYIVSPDADLFNSFIKNLHFPAISLPGTAKHPVFPSVPVHSCPFNNMHKPHVRSFLLLSTLSTVIHTHFPQSYPHLIFLLFSLFFTYAPTYPHYPQVYKSPLLPIFFPFQILFFCTHLINLHVFYIFSAFPLDIYKPALLVIQYSAYESQKQFL